MLLVFDIGNTNMVIGVYKGKELLTYWRIATDRQKTADEFGMLLYNLFEYKNIDPKEIDAVIYSSVVPPIMSALEEMAEEYFKCQPLVVGPG